MKIPRLPRLGLIGRIALLVVAIEIVGFGLLAWYSTSRMGESIADRMTQRAQAVGTMLSNDELPITALSRRALLARLLGAPYEQGVVVGGSGLVIVSTDPALLGRAPPTWPGVDPAWLGDGSTATHMVAQGDHMTAVMAVGPVGGEPLYHAVIRVSTADIAAMKRNVMIGGVAVSLLFMFLTSVGIVIVAQALIERRVVASLDVLRRVERGNLSERIPVPFNDEIGELQHGINSMTGKLALLLEQQRLDAAALQNQKDLLESIIQTAPIRVFWKDRDLRYLGCNQQFVHDAGFERPEDLIGKSDLDMPWREQAQAYRDDDRQVMDSGVAKLDFDEPQDTPHGGRIWLRTSKVPLRDDAGRVVGVLGIYSDITEHRRIEERIRHLAYFDPLTALPNRRLFVETLGRAMEVSAQRAAFGALLMFDLDNFKDLNDSRGHGVGDELLVAVSRRLSERMRGSDAVARLGGDEFVIIVEDLGSQADQAEAAAMRLGEAMRRLLLDPYRLDGGVLTHYCTVSIGVVLFFGVSKEHDVLLKQADLALYEAKSAGRNAVRLFSDAMQTAIDARARMAAGLHQALQRDEMQVYYQPQVDADGRLFGAEALMRWFPRDGQAVSPAVFIPLAEDNGIIEALGDWIIGQACAQLARWQADAATRGLRVAVNVSPHQFRQPDFLQRLQGHLARHAVDPVGLKLEITESVVLANVDAAIDIMRRARHLGVRFSLDDFGTGYSSLSYLKRLPLDQMKIDQSFIRDISHDQNDAAIVRAIIAMGNSLGLGVIAEGVETVAQRDFLQRHGCMQFQGYLFGRPLPIDAWNPQLLASVHAPAGTVVASRIDAQ